MISINDLKFMMELDLNLKVKSFTKSKFSNIVLDANVNWRGETVLEEVEVIVVFHAHRLFGTSTEEDMFDNVNTKVMIKSFTIIHENFTLVNSSKELFEDFTNDCNIVELLSEEFEEKVKKFLEKFAEIVV